MLANGPRNMRWKTEEVAGNCWGEGLIPLGWDNGNRARGGGRKGDRSMIYVTIHFLVWGFSTSERERERETERYSAEKLYNN